MTPEEIVAAVDGAGASVRLVNGKASLVGEVPPEVVEEIRKNREAFLDAWKFAQRDRWGKAPRVLVLRNVPPRMTLNESRRVGRFVLSQGQGVFIWFCDRVDAYKAKNFAATDASHAAMMDLLEWQLAASRIRPLKQLEIFDEVVAAL